MKAFTGILRRDLLLAMRRKAEVLTALFFFVIVSSLFPLGIGPEPSLLRKIGPGVLWVGALLATMLGLQRMFATDHADGILVTTDMVYRRPRTRGARSEEDQ